MKPNFRKVLEMALKHVENPHEDAVVDCVVDGAMNSIYEWFEFEENHVSD